MEKIHNKPANILLVEDNPGDILLAREALENEPQIELPVVSNGEEAIAYLEQEGDHSEAPRPDLVILDLNLPRKSGLEFLEKVKNDPRFRSIPVIVLTISGHEEDIEKAYENHANCFITKPVRLAEYAEIIQGIKNFWLDTTTLP